NEGSTCTAALPNRAIEDFRLAKQRGRGEVILISAPARESDYQTVVRILDRGSGESHYEFRLSWRVPEQPEGGLVFNNAFHFAAGGRGTFTENGGGSQALSQATVDIDRGGKILVSFSAAGRQPLTFTGTLMAPEGETLKADVAWASRAGMSGPMYLARDATGAIYRITLDATDGQARVHVEWRR
ncbi:MAG: hypothetical protein JO099_08150, partial [Acidobacteriia bacterium]|nr:hypothetical protein [Terriglobia bacterium]